MDVFLIIIASIMLIVGIIGTILPVLPSVPLCYMALLTLHFTSDTDFSTGFLLGWLAVTIIIQILDYVIPAWGTKHFGGSKLSSIGSVVGGIIGIFFGIVGIIVGSFIGAATGELINSKNTYKAFRAGIGSFVGFIVSTFTKVIICAIMAYYFVNAIVQIWN